MSRFKIVNLIDKLFISTAVFLIVFAWINFYIRNLWTTFILSIIFSGALLFVIFYISDKKKSKISQSKSENEKFNKYILAFRLTPKQKKYQLLYEILKNRYETTLTNNLLIYKKDNKRHLVIIATYIEKLSDNDIINLIDEYLIDEIDCLDIICNQNISTRKNFLNNLEINIIDSEKLYTDYFIASNTYPNLENLNQNISKTSFKTIIKNMFIPERAKSYFFCGLILIFSSIILPYHYYYLIFGSTLLLFSIACKLIPKLS